MTSIADGRAELVAALAAGGVRVTEDLGGIDPPGVIVSGAGVDVTGLSRGQVAAGHRLALLSGAWDSAAASRGLTELTDTVLGILRHLAGWAIGDPSGDGIIRAGGSDYYGLFITVRRLADIT